jgi:hypothetical protein
MISLELDYYGKKIKRVIKHHLVRWSEPVLAKRPPWIRSN